MTQDEQDTCRICSAPGEPGAPLFHPCKCSGTIRYIHQDCLTTWLAHSKKKTCDVCKYQYSFTKVYSQTMPQKIPFILFFRKFAQQAFWACIMALRGIMVTTIWLAFLPYVTVWTWRFYFIMGENIAWWINDRPRPAPTPIFYSYYANLTVADNRSKNETSSRSILGLATSYPLWRALSSDIFTGQIIASLIVLVFLGIFLLREWIMQNARPGVFEDDDLGEADAREGAEEVPVQQQEAQPQEPPAEIVQPLEPVREPADEAGHPGSPFLEHGVVRSERAYTPEFQFLSSRGSSSSSETSETTDIERDEDYSLSQRREYMSRNLHYRAARTHRTARFRTWSRSRDRDASHQKRKERSRSMNCSDGKRSMKVGTDDLFPSRSSDSIAQFEFTFSADRLSGAPTFGGSSSRFPSRTSFTFAATTEGSMQMTLSDQFRQSSSSSLSLSSNLGTNLRRPTLSNQMYTSPDDINASEIDRYLPEPDEYFPQVAPHYASDEQETAKRPVVSSSLATSRTPEELGAEPGPSRKGREFLDTATDNLERGSTMSSATAGSSDSQSKDDSEEVFFRDGSEESDADADDWFENPEDGAGLRQADDEEQNARVEDEPIPVAIVENGQAQGGADDQDVINEDDVDGALEEAIGMRGPLTTVFQNAALMIFVLDTTIGIAVWIPFTIGKTSALLFLEPIRILRLVQWPIWIIRYVTDPIVDLCFYPIQQAIAPFTTRATQVASEIHDGVVNESQRIIKESVSSRVPLIHVWISREPAIARVIGHVASSPAARFLSPYYAKIHDWMSSKLLLLQSAWIELANGDASVNRFFAIILGYFLVGLLVALYLNILNVGSVQSAGRAIRNAIKQQLIVLKVAIFIVIELCVFPLGCGILLDLCTLNLLPDTTLQSRLALLSYAPVTATFYHWMIGTMFMYQFAILLSGCRKIMRPGAMWFIKDPQDQNFHPIRDILDRPTLTQIRKLVISALMYSVVLVLGVGGLVSSLSACRSTLLPLRWKMREPIASIPIDLLCLHIVLPATIKHFRPRKFIHSLASNFWKHAARQLRLSSYMFGGIYLDEMRPSVDPISWLKSHFSPRRGKKARLVEDMRTDGIFKRVPAQDNIVLPREIRATVAVDRDGKPIDEANQRLMELQDAEAEKAKRNIKTDYAVVYMPPYFRKRVILFIIALWAAGSSVTVTALAIPLLLGRTVFEVFLNREVHDVYSLVVGFYLLWGCYYVGKTLDRMDKRRQRSSKVEPRGKYAVYVFKRSILWAGNLAWVAFWLGIVIPTLIALVMDVYLVHPIRMLFKPDLTLHIRITDSWALGLLYTKLALTTVRFRPETRVDAALKQMKDNGWKRLDAVAITFDIIAPITAGLLGMLILPITFMLSLQRLLLATTKLNTLFLYTYPCIFIGAVCVRLYAVLQTVFAAWAQQIRDTEFLIELRLRNLDPTPPSQKPTNGSRASASSLAPADRDMPA